jgi:hypothetical protein
LAAQLQQIAQQGGHAVLLGPQAIVQDYWLAERLHDAWTQLALVQQLPCALAVRHDLLAQTCQSLDLQPKPPDLAALVQAFAATASAQGMAIGHWDMAIVKASPEKSALKPSQAEST